MDFLKEKIEAADSDIRRHLEQEVSGLGKQMEDHQTDSRSAAASLSLKIQTLETQNAKVTDGNASDWRRRSPPPAPPTLCSGFTVAPLCYRSCPRSCPPCRRRQLQTPSTTSSHQSSSWPWRSGSLIASR